MFPMSRSFYQGADAAFFVASLCNADAAANAVRGKIGPQQIILQPFPEGL